MNNSSKRAEASRRNGKMFGGAKRQTLEQRKTALLGRINKRDSGCWEFQKCSPHSGYGYFGLMGKIEHAHRVSYKLFVGDIPKGIHVCHRCDNRSCVNPDHLFLGTPKDNVHDCISKGRNSPPPRNEILTEQQIDYVRTKHVPYKKSLPTIAKELGVTLGRIKTVKYGPTARI